MCFFSFAGRKDIYLVIMLWKQKMGQKDLSEYGYYSFVSKLVNQFLLSLLIYNFYVSRLVLGNVPCHECTHECMFDAKAINAAVFKKNHISFHSWYCKNMNRSQAEKLLKTEVNSITDIHNVIGGHPQISWTKFNLKLVKYTLVCFSPEQRRRLLGTGLKQGREIHRVFVQ